MCEFLTANPFVDSRIGENQIWGEERFPDLREINSGSYKTLCDDIDLVSNENLNHPTRIRFITGPPGAGKSHIFMRLRHSADRNIYFSFVNDHPTDVGAIKRRILSSLMRALSRPLVENEQTCLYSQLQALIYEMVFSHLQGGPCGRETVHSQILGGDQAMVNYITGRVGTFFQNLPIPLALARVFSKALEVDTAPIAVSWLSGDTGLTDDDLSRLGVSDFLQQDQYDNVFQIFGELAAATGRPIVLALDQLDQMTEEYINIFDGFLLNLMGNSKAWYVVISLLEEKYDEWLDALSPPLRTSLLAMGNGQYPSTELEPLRDPNIKRALLESRLNSRYLTYLRETYNADDYHPFTEPVFQQLCDNQAVFPRNFFDMASIKYIEVLNGEGPQPVTLAELLQSKLSDEISAITETNTPVDTFAIADRVEELVKIIHTGRNTRRGAGPLAANAAFNNRGTDRLYEVDAHKFRATCFDIQRAAIFPNMLNNLQNTYQNIPTLLLRDSRIPTRGQVTLQRLEEFKAQDPRHRFYRIPFNEMATLTALGRILASMRAGDFQGMDTEPPPVEENIHKTLSELSILNGMELWDILFSMAPAVEDTPGQTLPTGENVPPETPTLPAPPVYAAPNPEPDPNPDLSSAIQTVMVSARWLMLARLINRLRAIGHEAPLSEIIACLSADTLAGSVRVHPENAPSDEPLRYVVWIGA